MKALQLIKTGTPLRYSDVPNPIPGIREKIVQIKGAALNHRDLWIQQGQYAGIVTPIVLGSDGTGVLDGQEVIINPSLNWARPAASPPASFKILGLPDSGTFAEAVAVPSQNIFHKPDHLTTFEAAALPLAGLTAYRLLFTRCRFRAKDRVLISGIGGGVALMAFQFAVANGAEVWVTSSSTSKINKAIQMGAEGGVLYTDTDWAKKIQLASGGFDVIVDSAAGDGFGNLVKVANPGARIGLYGGTTGKINNVIPQIVFWKQISILGSTMGNGVEFSKMLAFVNKYKVKPVVDSVFALKDGNKAFQRMQSGQQFGKIVLNP